MGWPQSRDIRDCSGIHIRLAPSLTAHTVIDILYLFGVDIFFFTRLTFWLGITQTRRPGWTLLKNRESPRDAIFLTIFGLVPNSGICE